MPAGQFSPDLQIYAQGIGIKRLAAAGTTDSRRNLSAELQRLRLQHSAAAQKHSRRVLELMSAEHPHPAREPQRHYLEQ
jgi:hypothetical protein